MIGVFYFNRSYAEIEYGQRLSPGTSFMKAECPNKTSCAFSLGTECTTNTSAFIYCKYKQDLGYFYVKCYVECKVIYRENVLRLMPITFLCLEQGDRAPWGRIGY